MFHPPRNVSPLGPWFLSKVLAQGRQSGTLSWAVILMAANGGAEDLVIGHGFLCPELPPFATLSASTWLTFFFFFFGPSMLSSSNALSAKPFPSLPGSEELSLGHAR